VIEPPRHEDTKRTAKMSPMPSRCSVRPCAGCPDAWHKVRRYSSLCKWKAILSILQILSEILSSQIGVYVAYCIRTR